MFRFIGVGTILLVVASAVSAAAHYAEPWNRPRHADKRMGTPCIGNESLGNGRGFR